MANFDFRLVTAQALTRIYASDGPGYTMLIKRWAEAYLPLYGAKPLEISINGVAFRADGGVDGLVEAPLLMDPMGLVLPDSVFQFKAGRTPVGKAVAELLGEPKNGAIRIRDYLERGHRLIWFVGDDMTEPELDRFRAALRDAVATLTGAHPDPFVVDHNWFAKMLNRTPALALEAMGGTASGQTIRSALENDNRFRNPFVPAGTFEAYRADLEAFILSGEDGEDVRFIAGAPGLGKTRTVLEAIKANQGLADSTLYFNDPKEARDFLEIAKREGLRVVVIVDEYLGGASGGVRFDPNTLSLGCRAIVIGNAFKTDQTEPQYQKDVRPLSVEELTAVVQAAYPTATPEAIEQLVGYCKPNVRVTLLLARAALRGDQFELSPGQLKRLITVEIQKDEEGEEAMMRLSLIRFLPADQVESFCGLTRIDPQRFKEACKASSNRSEYVTYLRNVVHMSAPVLAHTALFNFWRKEREEMERILSSPGTFADAILQRLIELPPETEKEEMLGFFEPPMGDLTLQTFQRRGVGDRLLLMAMALPERYLPRLHSLFDRERGQLNELPYEGYGVERRDVIWRMRDLAQFKEHFEVCEEVVYWLAREEVESVYDNVATTYWPSWFYPWFDFTTYPYAARLDLLQKRIEQGDDRDRELAALVLVNPFPEIGAGIPNDVVSGRLAPRSLHRLNRDQYELALTRVPDLAVRLLESGNESVRLELAKGIAHNHFHWLDVLREPSPLVSIIRHELFNDEARRDLIVQVRQWVDRFEADPKASEQAKTKLGLYKMLLGEIGTDDLTVDARLVLRAQSFDVERSPQLLSMEARIADLAAESASFLQSIMPVILDPKSFGAARFGREIAARADQALVWRTLEESELTGTSQYLFGVLNKGIERWPGLAEEIEAMLQSKESEKPVWSLEVRSAIGARAYIAAALRLLRSGRITLREYQTRWWLFGEQTRDLAQDFIQYLVEQLDAGNELALSSALQVSLEATEGDSYWEDAQILALKAFVAASQSEGAQEHYAWPRIGEKLLEQNAPKVIQAIGSMEQGEYQSATALLVRAAPDHGNLVLDVLSNQLLDKGRKPYLFFGQLQGVLATIPADVFSQWLDQHGTDEAAVFARHLPRPKLDDTGKAIVAEQTTAFWERHPPGSDQFERLMGKFRAHTFYTGVIMGNGADLFEERIKLAGQMLNHKIPALRVWADGFLSESKSGLEDARRRDELDEAERKTEY